MPTHIFSLSERQFLDQHEKNGEALWEHNKHFLMRTYPKALRISSSNLNPAPFWGGGAQIVALNWQQTDEGMMLNEGMFAGTGGYVLKPQGYRPNLEKYPGPNQIVFQTLNLAITFYAGQAIPLPLDEKNAKGFKPYVKVELHVDASEGQWTRHITSDGHEREGEYKDKTKSHKGCDNIDFGGERLEFRNVPGLIEKLAFIRFTIWDDELGYDDLAAWACVRLDRLGNGYRFVHLTDIRGNLTSGALLVRIEKSLG